MKLRDLLDTDLLNQHCRDGYIKLTNHPRLPIYILNYTPECQFGNHWDAVTEQCRGLIVDDCGNVVARPFRKFFNLGTSYRPETHVENLPSGAPEVTDKLDGSLGIFWMYDGEYGIATRGSFTSDQALWASEWLNQQEWRHQLGFNSADETYLFEIIYPENRIVVKYDFEGLVLLGIVDAATGVEHTQREIDEIFGCAHRVVKRFPFNGIESLRSVQRDNAEGYILAWHDYYNPPFRIKVKFDEYLRLHRLITGLNPKALWELFKSGQNLDDLLKDVPDEFYRWVSTWKDALSGGFTKIEQSSKDAFDRIGGKSIDPKDREARRLFAERAKSEFPVTPILFAMLDGGDYSDTIWKMIKPRGDAETPFRKDES